MLSEDIDDQSKQPYRVPEYARLLGVSDHTIYEGVRRGIIPSVRILRTIRIPREAGDRILREGLPSPKAARK